MAVEWKLSSSNSGKSWFNNSSRTKIRVNYTAGNGTIRIDSIDGYSQSSGSNIFTKGTQTYYTITAGTQSHDFYKDVYCEVQFGAGSWLGWSTPNTHTFSNLNGNTTVTITTHCPDSIIMTSSFTGTIDAGQGTKQLDLNGYLDGSDSGNIQGYGTVNVTVGGSLKAQSVSDYCTSHTVNSSYVIDNIIPLTGHSYNGLASGSAPLSGSLDSNKDVRLNFTTNTYVINYDASGGTYSGGSTTYRYNASGVVALSSIIPTKSFASFSGWRYGGVTYLAGGNFPANLAQDVTVVAIWSPVVPVNIRVECLDRETNSLTMRVLYNAIDVTNIKLYYKRSQDDNYNYVEIDPSIGMTNLNNLDMDTNYDFYAEVTNAAGTGSSLD